MYISSNEIFSEPLSIRDNASRVIKYVVLPGYRHSHYNLVDMKIHDINVVADLNAHDPNAPNPDEPVDDDGTATGYRPAVAAISFIDLIINLTTANTMSWWTGWWPILHTRTASTFESGAVYVCQVAIDLLLTSEVEVFSFDTPLDDSIPETKIEALMEENWNEFSAAAFPIESVLYVAAELVAIVLDILLFTITKIPTVDQLLLYTALLVLWGGLMFAFMYSVWDGILAGRLTLGQAFGLLMVTAAVTAAESIVQGLAYLRFIKTHYYKRFLQGGVGFRVVWMAALCIFNVFLRLICVGIMLAMAFRIYEMQVSLLS